MAIPSAPPVVFVTASQDSAIAVTALKAGAADYLVKDAQGDFIPLLQVAVDGAIRQALDSQGARRGRGRGPRLARPLCGAGRRARDAAARGQPPRRQLVCRSSPRCCICRPIPAPQEDVKAALTNAMGRVAAVAQVHRRLYTSHDLKSVLLNQYLEALLEDLRRSAEGNQMSRLTLKAEPVEIDPDRAVAIGIIVNELVMNAVKYAYPDGAGPIHVELDDHGRRCRAVDHRRRRRPQRQDRPALDRHGPAHRLRDGAEARRRRRARSRPCRHADRAAFRRAKSAPAQARKRRGLIGLRSPRSVASHGSTITQTVR